MSATVRGGAAGQSCFKGRRCVLPAPHRVPGGGALRRVLPRHGSARRGVARRAEPEGAKADDDDAAAPTTEAANGVHAELTIDPEEVEIEYLSPESPDPDDSELTPYHNDQPIDGLEREVMSLEEVAQLTEEGKKMGLDKVQAAGPEAIFVAGFRIAELPLLHSVLGADGESGEGAVRMIAVTDEILGMPVGRALDSVSVTWDAVMGRVGSCSAWGAERVLLFSGFSLKAQATMLEMVEELGFGRLTPGQVDEGDMEKRVGDVLAEAVQEYRRAVQRSKDGRAPAWEQEAAQQQQQQQGGTGPAPDGQGNADGSPDWNSLLPNGYDLSSDDPSNLGNAIRSDGSINQAYVGSLMENVKGQMIQALEDQGVDPSELGDLSVGVGSQAAEPKPSGGAPGQQGQDSEESDAGPEYVDLTPLQAQFMERSGEGQGQVVPEAEEKEPRGSLKGLNGAAAPEEATAEASGAQDEATQELLDAFEAALGSGLSREDLEALIDSAYSEAEEPIESFSASSEAVQMEPPAGGKGEVLDDDSEELFRKPTDGGNYVNVAEFRDLLLKANENPGGSDAAAGPTKAKGEEVEEDGSTMTRSQLRETAERHSLDFDDLLRDAESRGIKIRDG